MRNRCDRPCHRPTRPFTLLPLGAAGQHGTRPVGKSAFDDRTDPCAQYRRGAGVRRGPAGCGERGAQGLEFGDGPVAQGLAALSAGATSALLVVVVRDRLRLGAEGYGIALACIGLGAAAGPLLLTRFVTNPRRPAFVFGPYLLRAAVDLVLAAVRVPAIALGSLAGYGVGTSTGAVTFNSLLQAETPPTARGRVFAAFDLIWQLGRLASLGLGGLLADRSDIAAVYIAGAALLAAAALIGYAGLVHHPPPPEARLGDTAP